MNKIKCTTSIAILMATYNGEKYLREQIDSIISQTCADWTLYIQDDGSQDHTLDIIRSFDDARIVLVDRGLTHQGAGGNFMSLLNMVESDYYMFCDQDDVWFPNKIDVEYAKIKDLERKYAALPILVFTDKARGDASLNVICRSEFFRHIKDESIVRDRLNRRINKDVVKIVTTISGCTMMFNKNVKKYGFPYCNVRYHDSIVTMTVLNNSGVVEAIFQPTMIYRIHSSNLNGSEISRNSFMLRISNLKKIFNENLRAYYIWKIYGGGNLLKFLHCKYILYRTRF